MAGLIPCHLVNCVVDSVQVVLLAELSKIELALGSAVFAVYSPLEVLLCAVGHVGLKIGSQKLRKLCSVLSFFPCSLFPVETYLWIAFSVSYSCHAEVHAYLGAFALEVSLELLDYISLVFLAGNSVKIHAYAEYMLSCKRRGFVHKLELASGNFAYGALEICRDLIAFINITAYRAHILFFFLFLLN